MSNAVAVHHAAARKEGNYLFPLYLYPDTSNVGLWDAHETLPHTPGHRRANLAPAFIADCAARLGMTWVEDGKGDRATTFGPEDVFSYLYAVLHAPTYRERYAEFLKSDFPRVPLTRDPDLFRALCAAGDRLVALHLLEARATPITRYPIRGDNRVTKITYAEPTPSASASAEAATAAFAAATPLDAGSPAGAPARASAATPGRVWINDTQYFEGVPPEVWEAHIGGYQVCEKWLKDRKGRTLTYDDLEHYQAVVAALAETLTLMEGIDATIEDHGGWPIG